MTVILVYGSDGTGKSVQCKSIAEYADNPEHWSFATKNRRLYEESGVPSVELLRFNLDATINPYRTMDMWTEKILETVKSDKDLIVIDEITLLRQWAQPVVIEEVNKERRSKQKPPITKIGENNASAWAAVNKLVYGRLEILANWAEINKRTVVAITSMIEERRMSVDSDGEAKSVTTGRWVADAKLNILKLADVRIKLEKDGSRGKGYYAFFEKTQEWMAPGDEVIKVGKDGVLTELMKRGVLK